ncbi:flagellar hook-associated protein FlgK [Halovulum dunhuangense]|uniref:Flagellar hook-associated protein 1 n=1 Tax=Halovulum dunhuangense TaxID=1505036 RepID=A0A849KZL5_9RHOB|nr:flagellar hook-associated protein FlgK [Halovulum dunhuangense]NNU79274.1 flagellar hook-associated protein FlgK [Halovulum dunhuangense]
MSLSTALNNALSGLNVSTREAELVATNIANAQTPGYTTRTAELSAVIVGDTGAGVRVTGVTLVENAAAIAERRRADAALALGSTEAGGLAMITDLMGLPGSGTALADRAAAFETALMAAANDPASDHRLAEAVADGAHYAEAIAALSTETQSARLAADTEIAGQVALVNQNLQSIEMLNREIQMRSFAGGDASALVDARKALIDEVSAILPIRSATRPHGAVALFTENGATLIDGQAATLGFSPTATITQDMTLASGALSGLTLDGRPFGIGASDRSGAGDGGSLGALFVLRDTTMPAIADQLDRLAEDLVQRFQAAGLDPSRAPGDPGLFTDGGAFYDPANRSGLAGRIELNAAVVPSAGGMPSRLRDGLGATGPGEIGDARLLSELYSAARAPRLADPALGISGSRGLSEMAAGLTSLMSSRQQRAEQAMGHAAALHSTLRDAELSVSGVNTDTQMQKLLLVEQSYAANAFVLSTIDDMIRRLMEI